MIGRKLNMLMAELKMKSKEPMSKQQLQKLCEHERDVMLLHLEDVALAARRYGRPAAIEELELDLENGWAYKLLATFGIRQHLRLKEGCSGHRYLVANGIPASHIPAIKSNYIELFDEANSRAFQDGIRMLMDQFGIAQHPLNHEKAMKAYFEGRACPSFDGSANKWLHQRLGIESSRRPCPPAPLGHWPRGEMDEAYVSPSPFRKRQARLIWVKYPMETTHGMTCHIAPSQAL
ncbi:hypothetical protein J2Z31_002020 [Sinorhizobium kostiense]|uniref:Uncharacterized protein n=1 Tax=Sinorhizobium kostiense TaxID=76747 RepID=A0ABS4QY09_9HYPH|nr:hypothetical protein [Sinorhizobium kostiense]MBP2235528.1 hypothetical protein [Sinorhizobium kostiense]